MELPPLPPSAFPAPAQPDTPSRVAVFFHVLLRSFVAAVGGGIAVAVGFVVVVVIVDRSNFEGLNGADSGDGVLTALLIGAFIGAVFGFALGIAAGLLLGLVAAIALVPYRGRRVSRLTMRIGAPLCVAGFFGLFLGGDDDRVWMLLAAPGVVGAVLLAPFLVGWYIRRAEPA